MTGATRACLEDLIASTVAILEKHHGREVGRIKREVVRLKAEHARQLLDLKRENATLRDLAKRVGTSDEIEWDLTRTERRMFHLLAMNKMVSLDDLFVVVERDDHFVGSDAIKTHIYNLRRKIDPHGFRILSMRGKGYRLSRLISAS